MANGGGFFTSGGDIMPTIDEDRVPNLQWQTTFTADPDQDLLTCAIPHTQITAEVVMLTSTGTLPAPFIPFTLYRVLNILDYLLWGTVTMASNGHPPDVPTRQPRLVVHTGTPHGLTVGTNVWFQAGAFGNGLPPAIIQGEVLRIGTDDFTSTSFELTGLYIDPTYGYAPVPWTGPYVPPPPAEPIQMFYSSTSGTNLKLAENAGWDPPPENPAIDITDAGVGVHQLWIRPLDYVGKVNSLDGTYISAEDLGTPRGAIYLNNAVRHQYKNPSGGAFAWGGAINTDYWTSDAHQIPKTKWRSGFSPGMTGANADLYSYGYPNKSLWGLGDLGAHVVGANEHYYSICGNCAFGGGGPPTGGGSGKAGQEPLSPDRQIKIEYKDQDITNLVRRAQKASNTIENMRIVGPGVSGGGGQWAVNPD